MKFNRYKRDKRAVNFKVIATTSVAITLIGIMGISIGKYAGANFLKTGVILDTFTSIQSQVSKGFGFVEENLSDLINYKKNSQIIDELENENEKLQEEIISLNNKLDQTKSLDSLKKSLNFVDEKYEANSVSASVVGKNDGNWYTSITIAAGSDDGVTKDSIVVNGDGLVGIVYEVSSNYSKAISILDNKSSVSFKLVENDKYKGVLSQSSAIRIDEAYKDEGLLQGYMLDSSYEVSQGDVIVTSGLGIYPEGIPIGEIRKIVDDKNKSIKNVVIKPYVDFKNIDDVMVINPRDIG